MINPHLLDELTERGLVAQNSDPAALADHLATPRTVYCGFDPTAGSLHIGHLVPLLMLRRFQLAGHTPVALVGGATGLIGDPSFKATERSLNSADTVQGWVASLSAQIRALLPADEGLSAPQLVNNGDWMGQMSALDFLRDIGKHFSVNAMLARESVRQRLARRIRASRSPSSPTLCCNPTTLRCCTSGSVAPCRLAATTSGAISPVAWISPVASIRRRCTA